jgi:hypothetical protein
MVLEQDDAHGMEVGVFEGFGKADKDVLILPTGSMAAQMIGDDAGR